VESPDFSVTLSVPQPDGQRKPVDIRTLPFVRFECNESHTQRRHAFNFGGFSPLARSAQNKGANEGVAGIGPDEQHPFVIKDYLAWDVHWALHPRPPSVMIDGMEAAHSHYALWFANYDHHAYRGVKLTDITVNPDFQPIGTQPKEAEFPGTLSPVDDLPPQTIITHVLRQNDVTLLVRGTTADNAEVKKVLVNGTPAHETASNLSQWEITVPAAAKLTASATDKAGNAEARPHVLLVP
jgi:hypothetical protein